MANPIAYDEPPYGTVEELSAGTRLSVDEDVARGSSVIDMLKRARQAQTTIDTDEVHDTVSAYDQAISIQDFWYKVIAAAKCAAPGDTEGQNDVVDFIDHVRADSATLRGLPFLRTSMNIAMLWRVGMPAVELTNIHELAARLTHAQILDMRHEAMELFQKVLEQPRRLVADDEPLSHQDTLERSVSDTLTPVVSWLEVAGEDLVQRVNAGRFLEPGHGIWNPAQIGPLGLEAGVDDNAYYSRSRWRFWMLRFLEIHQEAQQRGQADLVRISSWGFQLIRQRDNDIVVT